jgi:hypothetical protein
MANRFTEQLEQIPENELTGFYWQDVPVEIFCVLDKLSYSTAEMINVKWLAICFIAAMSDEDLDECFGI